MSRREFVICGQGAALDLSAAGGYTTELLARSIGPAGKVYGQSRPRDPNQAPTSSSVPKGNSRPNLAPVATPAAPPAAPRRLRLVDELGRVGRLKRFLAPQLAELIVSQGDEKILKSHRREIVVVFCDLRGYTAFTETAEPEEVLDFLREYHGALGPLVSQYEGTLDQFSGDGIMVFFNDPVPCPDPAERAVKMAMAMREEAGKLIVARHRDGCELGFGAGIAQSLVRITGSPGREVRVG